LGVGGDCRRPVEHYARSADRLGERDRYSRVHIAESILHPRFERPSIRRVHGRALVLALIDRDDNRIEFDGDVGVVASDVESSLYAGLQRGNAGLKNRGVKKAPFVVLIGANMPSVLAEISFVTNPRDAGQLRQPEYRQRVAESLYKGVAKYEGGLSAAKGPTERASK